MKQIDDGGAAFPSITIDENWDSDREKYCVEGRSHGGMTLRAYVATAAMRGIISHGIEGWTSAEVAEASMKHADALIAALNQTANPRALAGGG